jgi:subtilisin family serine protease
MSAYDNDIGIRGIADGLNLYSADLWTGADSDSSFHTMGELMAIYNNMAYNDVRVINNSWGCYIFDKYMYKDLMEGNALPYDEWHETRVNDLVPTAEATIVMMSQLIASGNENMIFVQAAGNGYYGYYYTPANSITNGFFGSVTEEVYNGLDSKIQTYLDENGITYDSINERIYNVTAVDYYYDDDGEIVYEIADFANYGDTVDICAPGVGIYSTMNEGDFIYSYADGTSMAAPMVTASIGLVWSHNPDLSVSKIREVMFDSSQRDVSCEIDGKTYTYPMLNVGIAVQIVAGD